MIKRIFSCVLPAIATLPLTLPAQASSVIGGGYPGEYLTLYAPSARSLALGGASTRGGDSVYFNPAQLAGQPSKEFSFMKSPLPEGASYMSAFFAFPRGTRKSFSAGFITTGIDGAEWVDSFGVGNRGTFSDAKQAYFLGMSFPVTKYMSSGVTLKAVTQKIHTYSASGYGLDIGFSYLKHPTFVPSLAIQNLVAPALKLRSDAGAGKDTFPVNARLSFFTNPFKNFNFTLDGVMENLAPAMGEKSVMYVCAGAEYGFGEILKLRLGYNPSNISGGFGIKLGRADFDWAVTVGDAGQMYTAGIVVRWGMMPQLWQKQLSDREKYLKDFSKNLEIEKKYVKEKDTKAESVNKEAVNSRINAAKRYLNSHEYSSALNELNAALKLEPENEKASKLKKDISSGKLKADLSYALGVQYYKNGDYKHALKKMNKALKRNRDHVDAKFMRRMTIARIFIDKGNYFQAKQQLLQAFKIYPDSKECLTLLDGINGLMSAGGKEKK